MPEADRQAGRQAAPRAARTHARRCPANARHIRSPGAAGLTGAGGTASRTPAQFIVAISQLHPQSGHLIAQAVDDVLLGVPLLAGSVPLLAGSVPLGSEGLNQRFQTRDGLGRQPVGNMQARVRAGFQLSAVQTLQSGAAPCQLLQLPTVARMPLGAQLLALQLPILLPSFGVSSCTAWMQWSQGGRHLQGRVLRHRFQQQHMLLPRRTPAGVAAGPPPASTSKPRSLPGVAPA